MKARSSRVITVPVTALVAALVLAACGGSGSTTTSSTSSSPSASAGATPGATFAAARAKLAACLQKQGVKLPAGGFGGRRFGATGATGATGPFRRFGATGRRFFGATGGTGVPGTGFPPGGAGAFVTNPKFAAAFAKCGGAAGFGGGFGRGRFGATGASGVGEVASPQYRAEVISYAACMKSNGVSLPTPNFSGTGFVFGTKVNRTTTRFIAANAKCASLLTAPASAGPTG